MFQHHIGGHRGIENNVFDDQVHAQWVCHYGILISKSYNSNEKLCIVAVICYSHKMIFEQF